MANAEVKETGLNFTIKVAIPPFSPPNENPPHHTLHLIPDCLSGSHVYFSVSPASCELLATVVFEAYPQGSKQLHKVFQYGVYSCSLWKSLESPPWVFVPQLVSGFPAWSLDSLCRL